MKHLDLFSGIGGFSLALDNVYGKENINHTFVEIDPFCQAVLKKHWPEAEIYGDIRTVTNTICNDAHRKRTESKRRELGITTSSEKIDFLTGGFPCQPFSQAGRRKGTQDDRFLWPEMLRIITEFRPTWIIGENVAGILSMVQHESNPGVEGEADTQDDYDGDEGANGIIWDIINDIEQAGYSVQTFVIPAVAVNAPHRRDRVWIIARWNDAYSSVSNNAGREGGELTGTFERRREKPHQPASELHKSRGDWNQNWLEVATRLCRLDDGLPTGLPRPKGWRNAALKALGNSIVPQVAEEIFKAIKKIDD